MQKLLNWVDERLPVVDAWNKHLAKYYAPKNFNMWYFFGSLAMLVLVNQLVTGIWLTMSYNPSAEGAFASVEYIMRDVEWGWLLRYLHSTGASAFFVVVYLHMFRGLMYGSYQKPRELIWIFGMLIYLVLMAEAFMGYLLPWGQMSYWGAQVIVNLFGAIPVIGEDLSLWIRGDYLISGITLNRFFALHVVALPIVLLGLVVLHILALHEVGSNNPDGIEIKKNKDENGIPKDGIPFHPYYTVHDLLGVAVFFFIVTVDLFGLDAKFWGVVVMGAAIAILFVLPWLDRSPVRSIRYKGWLSKIALAIFAVSFIILGYLGIVPATEGRTTAAQILTALYFLYFILMPFYTRMEKTKPVPERVTG